jgi:hypothetical protein
VRRVLRVAVPALVLAWFFVADATGRPAWFDRTLERVRGVSRQSAPPPGEVLAEQVSEALRTRFGRAAKASDQIHFIAPPRPIAWSEDVERTAELDEYADRVPDDAPVWRPLGPVGAAYGAVLRQVDLKRVYGSVASLRGPLAQLETARKQLDARQPDPGAAGRLRDSLELLQRAVAAEPGQRDERFRLAASRCARAWSRYQGLSAGADAAAAPGSRPAYRLSPTPLSWRNGASPVLLAAAVPEPDPSPKAAAAARPRGVPSALELTAAISSKRIGVLDIEPEDWFDFEALRFIAANDLLADADGVWRRSFPRMPVLLLVASDPRVAIDLPGVRPEDVAGGSVSVEGTPKETRASFRLETDGKIARLIYEPVTLYVVGVVSSEVYRP